MSLQYSLFSWPLYHKTKSDFREKNMLYEKTLPIHFLQDLSFAVGLKTGFLILKKFASSPISRMSRFQGDCSQGNSRCCHWPGKPFLP